MTDTGRIPGEGQPENAGAPQEQPGVPASGGYTFPDPAPGPGADQDDQLLMPSSQGAWGEPLNSGQYYRQPMPADAPVHTHAPAHAPAQGAVDHLPENHETDGRDSGVHDYSAVRMHADGGQPLGGGTHGRHTPAGGVPVDGTPAGGVPAGGTPPGGVPRRPLHLGPPVPEQSGAVRSLADRGPSGPPAASRPAPVQQPVEPLAAAPQPPDGGYGPGMPAPGPRPEDGTGGYPQQGAPEYLDVSMATGPATMPDPSQLPGPQLGELPGPQLGELPGRSGPWQQVAPASEPQPGAATGETPLPTGAEHESFPEAQPVEPAAAEAGVQGEAAVQATPVQSAPVEPGTGAPAAVEPAAVEAGAAEATAEPVAAEPVPVEAAPSEPAEAAPVAVDGEAVAPGEPQEPGAEAAAPGHPIALGAAAPAPAVDAHGNPLPSAVEGLPHAAAPQQAGAPQQVTIPAPAAETPLAAGPAVPAPGAASPQGPEAGDPLTDPLPEQVQASPAEPVAAVAVAPVEAASSGGTGESAGRQPAGSGPSESGQAVAAESSAAAPVQMVPGPRAAEPQPAPASSDAAQPTAAADPVQAPGEQPSPQADPGPTVHAMPAAEPAPPAEPSDEPSAQASAQPAAPAEPAPGAEPAQPAAEDVPADPAPAEAPPAEPVSAEAVPAEPVSAEPAPAAAEPVVAEGETATDPATASAEAAQPAVSEGAADAARPAEAPAAEEAAPQGPPAPGYSDADRDAVHRAMRDRRDIRNGFRADAIPHEVLLRVLEAAHTAPSVGHSQPWDFVIIRSEETRRRMHELALRQRDAYAASLPKARAKQFKELKIEAILDTPVNIVVTADGTRGGRHTLGRHTQPQMAPYSSALAVENLWLAARAEGLGVGWVSFFDEREMVSELGLPEHLEVVAYLCVGYVDEFPDEPELVQAGWSKRRPLSWVVHEESYGRRILPGAEPHDLLSETLAAIRPLDAKALGEAWERQKRMTKPSGALGMLEIISAQLSGLARQCPPPIPEPAAVAIFAGDHGVHAQGVTAWPQEVTGQMVANFLGGGAVCNAFAGQVGAEVCVIDVGVAGTLPATPGLLPRKVRPGTADFTAGPAMTREEATRALEVGIETARDLVTAGNRALLTGEMGIANTTVSAALISVYTGVDPAEVTGRGTGVSDEMHAHKVEVVRRALELHDVDPTDPIGVLAAIGGLEHAAMVGLILGGASLRTPVILDGVSAGAAALVARAMAPEALAACIAGHRSAEPGHLAALNTLGLRPLVDLDLRLGEGTGALLALPIVQSAARAMHEVATFDAAGVTEKN
ncbi:nicotinate-nucleotide--dimethylbenzimidazole phosphoribosyltransferase [Streptomyces alkaliterrae]|uniref:Nicotinate-nucleotide--dimethylbenzimidazole phosphoribosyltransferase n=1 Tax=Streptomyces alkaliterrae TaxID=2213162 RepID=A0A5P0YR20_9ACTN|nr:nicotinate-nucleotide--dimethylbenzimidazole phosphoribosyltransferase [Streptomyces alkaliterrae]MBB1260514.1 nicotinate-nucleotide--dimethylbenzimidazole phosphoribosyltransferase [Streptomyces alkaliterrae]MQS02763.1 nicotinate-nucleotide--dimethylbenzimidazole phosphoribosyltransferase [Streptomyces alkaliterrae]